MAITNILTFSLGYCRRDDPAREVINTFTFSVYYDRALYDEPKDIAIEHAIKIKNAAEFVDLLPVFRTFRVVRDYIPSDLGLK